MTTLASFYLFIMTFIEMKTTLRTNHHLHILPVGFKEKLLLVDFVTISRKVSQSCFILVYNIQSTAEWMYFSTFSIAFDVQSFNVLHIKDAAT
jgi:hypothetical protein